MKVLKIAAIVVGTVASIALIASGVGAPIGAGLLGVTWGAIAAGAGLIGAALNFLDPPKPPGSGTSSAVGSQTSVTLDPQAGSPYIMGRTFYAGTIVEQDTYGSNNEYIGTAFVYGGGGPYHQFEAFQVDQTTVTFSGGAATSGGYAGFMWLKTQLGQCPESSALLPSQGTLPGWGSSNKLSGYCASLLELKFDKNGKVFSGGYPQVGAIIQGALVYDPRLDSTYPGGSGSCRSNDETTFVYSENPWLHAITWALGRYQNAKRVLGVGLAAAGIVLPSYVEAANIADTNGWKVGGVVSSEDDKWDVLKNICQAGSGEPIRLGGLLSCRVDTPRVALDTVNSADIVGTSKASGTYPRKNRYNTAIARYRSEANGWQVVPTNPISVSTYVTLDGGTRSKELDFPLVQQLTQVGQLATYQICNAREFGPIVLQLKPRFAGYKPGDCLNLNIPELGLNNQLAIVTDRNFTPETGVVTLTFNSETTSKHAFALGQTTTAPPAPSLAPRDITAVAAPGAGAWTLSATSLTGSGSESVPVLHIAGALDNPAASAIIVEYRIDGTTAWSNGVQLSPATVAFDISGLKPGTAYDVALSYVVLGVQGTRRILGPVTVGALSGTPTDWVDVTSRPSNLAALTGAEPLKNDLITMRADGVLVGGGTSTQVDATQVHNGTAEAGADKTQNQQVTVDWSAVTGVTLSADSSGSIVSGQLPMVLPIPKVTKGGTSVAGDNLTSYSITGSTYSAGYISVDNTNGSSTKGQVTIGSSVATAGGFNLVVSYNSVTVAIIPVTVGVKNAAPTSGGGSGSTSGNFDVSDSVTSSSSFVQVGSTVTVTVASGKSISGTFGDTYNVSGLSHTCHAVMMWRYAAAGTSFASSTNFSVSAAVGSDATSDSDFNQYPGSITCNQSVTPAAGTYDVGLFAEKSGTGGITFDLATAYVNVA